MNARLTTTSVMQQFRKLLGVLILSMFSLQAMAAESPVVVNVDNRVKVSFSKVKFNAKKGIYSTLVRINNQSDTALFSPLRLSFDQNALKARKVRLLNARKKGKDGQPYFEFALRKGKLVAGGTTRAVRVVYSVRKDRRKRAKRIPPRVVQSLFASTYHVSAGVKSALLNLRANPYALPVNTGKQAVRFSVLVRLAKASKTPVTVFLRRKGDKQSIKMNDLGKDGDYVAEDGLYGVGVQIDTNKIEPDTCLVYEAFTKEGRSELISPKLRLCVSSFPVRAATPNVDEPVVLDDGVKAVADEVLLYAKPTTSAATIRELAHSVNASVVGSIIPLNLYQLRLPSPVSADNLQGIVAKLNVRNEIVGASVNALARPAGHVDATTDPEFANQDGVKLVLKHPTLAGNYVWDADAMGTGETIVVTDYGLDRAHPDFGVPGDCQLSTSAAPGVANTNCGGTNNDSAAAGVYQWHGTRVAGIIAAKAYNSQGIAGVAHGSKIYSYKIASFTLIDMDQIFIDAGGYVISESASVINASISGGPWSGVGYAAAVTALCTAVNTAVTSGAGAIAVIAAGNYGADNWYYPARCNEHAAVPVANRSRIIAVGNSTSVITANCGSVAVDQRCAAAVPANPDLLGSCYGAWVDIMAPGSDIRTTTSGGTYTSSTGTSFSAPIVSGAVAILKSCGVALDSIKSTLISGTAVTVPYPSSGSVTTTPRLDVYAALDQVSNAPTGITPSIFSLNENIDTTGGYDVGTLSAVDTDTCDSYTYSINGGADAASFSINPPNTLRINAGVLDYETKSSYAVTVRVTDFFGDTFDQAMTVNVNDLNEAPTAVVLTNQVPSTPENGGSIKVADISVTDDALGTNVLSLGGTDAASFNIVGTELYFNGGANYEVKSSYNVAVEVDDVSVGATPDATQGFTLTISDANDPPTGLPVIQPPATAGNRTVGDTITADTSAVADEDGLGVFSYQWRRGVTDIPGATASSYVLAAADVGEFMSLCVSYTDGGGYSEGPLCSVADAVAVGDPHITTIDGLHYDFQSAGEFVALRDANGMELQLRMTPVSTATPLTDPNSGLTSGVSINTALAARVGDHRVTYQPDISPGAASGAPVLRVDGVLTTPSADGLDLGDGGSVSSTGNGIQIDFPDGTTVIASSSLWSYYNVWWLHVSVFHTPAQEGIMGARSNGSWLPKLSDGSALGAMPAALHDRYVQLYVTFADSWRVTDSTSLFDYADGTSTATFTNKAWPTENGPYVVDSGPVVKPLGLKAAQLACRQVKGKNEKADCVFDVRVMGQKAIAKPHLLAQKIRTGATFIKVRDDRDMNRRVVTFTATVAKHAAPARGVIKAKARAKNVPKGWVQFTLNGKKAGRPVKLNSKGQATWKVSRQKVTKQTVGARYLPAKRSIFLPSRNPGMVRLPVDVKKTTNMRVMKK